MRKIRTVSCHNAVTTTRCSQMVVTTTALARLEYYDKKYESVFLTCAHHLTFNSCVIAAKERLVLMCNDHAYDSSIRVDHLMQYSELLRDHHWPVEGTDIMLKRGAKVESGELRYETIGHYRLRITDWVIDSPSCTVWLFGQYYSHLFSRLWSITTSYFSQHYSLKNRVLLGCMHIGFCGWWK